MDQDSTCAARAVEQAPSIPDAFLRRLRQTPTASAYKEFRDGTWREVSWQEVSDAVARRRSALAAAGLSPGERVGIFLPNSVDWVVTDLAAMAEGLVTVPLYTRDSAANTCHVIRDCGAALCITDSAERWSLLGAEKDALPELRQVWVLDGAPGATDGRLQAAPEPASGAGAPGAPFAASRDDLATIIYTSGTTGPPKGVMLSHGALLWNAEAVMQIHALRSDDLFLSILPLAHAFERTLGWLCPLLGGATVAFARSIETLREDMQSLDPTILLAVPRLFEKARIAAQAQADKSWLTRGLLRLTEDIGWRRRQAAEGAAPPPGLAARLFWWLLGHRVARRIRHAFGTRLRIVLSGGAPLSEATAGFMAAIEMPLIEGYGLTEAGPAVTGCTLEDRRIGSVGRALPGAELSIGDRHELLVRSPGVMLGYWNRPDATREAVDADGWLHTGDAARIVEGRVWISGRLKDILVLSTGENVNPVPIESAILADPLVEQASVLGDGKPWCAAIVVVNPTAFAAWARQAHLDGSDPNEAKTRDALTRRLAGRMENVPPFARIRNVHIETEPWDLESGLITPTLKAKRPKVVERYAEEISALYG